MRLTMICLMMLVLFASAVYSMYSPDKSLLLDTVGFLMLALLIAIAVMRVVQS